MSIFRRRGKVAAQPDAADQTEQTDDTDATGSAVDAGAGGGSASTDGLAAAGGGRARGSVASAESSDGDGSEPAPSLPSDRSAGPWDRSEVSDPGGRLDLGSLWVAGLPGMELRLEVDEAQTVVAVNAVVADSALHLQAFAAPRSEGVWRDIRTEIAASLTRQGGTADEVAGPFGTELRAQMPAQGTGGRIVYSPARFIGVDGPRWFLRAVLSGPAAQDDAVAEALLAVVRETVVVRGDEAMAPRDLLPLTLPRVDEATGEPLDGVDHEGPDTDGADADRADRRGAEQDGVDSDGVEQNGRAHARSGEDFRPFERGPEITEIR